MISFFNLKELPITTISENAMKNAPHIGLSKPIAAIGMAIILENAQNKFCLIVKSVCLLILSAKYLT